MHIRSNNNVFLTWVSIVQGTSHVVISYARHYIFMHIRSNNNLFLTRVSIVQGTSHVVISYARHK